MGDEVFCRSEKACATRQAEQPVVTPPSPESTNWTTDSIWQARDKQVVTHGGPAWRVKLYAAGWTVGPYDGMDIWSACRVLNDVEARLIDEQ
jgi:hypothetical protein